MIKVLEDFDYYAPLTLVHKNGEEIFYVSPYALDCEYLLASYSDEDGCWYFQNASDDFELLRDIASRIPWDKVDPWIVKVIDCEAF